MFDPPYNLQTCYDNASSKLMFPPSDITLRDLWVSGREESVTRAFAVSEALTRDTPAALPLNQE